MHPSFKAATSTTAAVRAAATTATTLSSYTARTSRLTAAGLAACRNPPPPPHAPKTSLPPFRAPPLTPVFEIRSRSYSSTSRSSGGPRKGSSSSSSNTDPNSPQYKAAERKVRTAIIALPVVFVTSWVLYQRLVLGQERKVLPRDPVV